MSADVMDSQNVRMIQRADSLCLLLESPQAIGVLREGCRQNLDSHVAIKLLITRAIHFPHSADADYGPNLISS